MDEATRAILHRESGLSSKEFSSFYQAAEIIVEAEWNGGEFMYDLDRWVDRYVDAYAGPVVWGDGYRRWRYPDDRTLYFTPSPPPSLLPKPCNWSWGLLMKGMKCRIRKFVRKVVVLICNSISIEDSEKESTRQRHHHRKGSSCAELDLSASNFKNQNTKSVAPARGEPSSSTVPEKEKEREKEKSSKKSIPGKRRSQPPRGTVSKSYAEPDDDLVYPDIPTPAPALKRKRVPLQPVASTPTKEASSTKRRKLLPPPPQFPPPATDAHPPREPEKRSFSPPLSPPPATIATATTTLSPLPPSSPHPRVFKTYIAGSPSIKLVHVEDFSPVPTMRAFLEHIGTRWGTPASSRSCDANVEVEVAGERYECREERDWREVLEMVKEGEEERVVVRVDGGVV